MKARIKWIEGMSFAGESGSGHTVVIDGPAEHGGRNIGVRPMEMLLLGLGSCSAFDVVHILNKGRTSFTDCVVELSAERADTDPKVFTAIHMHFVITGAQLKPHVVERAVNLSVEKYCSAAAMLGKTAKITHDFEIRSGAVETA